MPSRAKGAAANGAEATSSSSLKITVNGLPIDRPCPPERILLAFDGSPHSIAAGHFLAHLPQPASALVDVLAVMEGMDSRYSRHGPRDLADLVALE